MNKIKTTKMGWPWCCFRSEPAYKQVDTADVEAEPARYISSRLDSEYDVENFQLKNTVSSLYRRVSEWSLPKKQEKQNLFTVNEEEHDFLMGEPEPEPEPDPVQHLRPRHTVSSIYSKVSDWSSSQKLDTVKEEHHECLMDEYTPMPSPPPMYEDRGPSPSSFSSSSLPQTDNFDDVVDEMV